MTCWNNCILDTLSWISYIIKINFACLLNFLNVATTNVYITYVAHILLLLQSSALGFNPFIPNVQVFHHNALC